MGFLQKHFETLDLQALSQRTAWEKRNDSKFLAPIAALDELLACFAPDYLLLENNGSRVALYHTEYLDTVDYNMYFEHQRDRAHRFKIRRRRYGNESQFWLEVKEKMPDGKTVKHRLFNPSSDEEAGFVQKHTPYRWDELLPSLQVKYERITLLHKSLPLKVTLDSKLTASDSNKTVHFNELLIVEFKSENKECNRVEKLMKPMRLKPCSLSKYCIAMATLHPELKQNAFKPTLLQIKKVTDYGNPEPV